MIEIKAPNDIPYLKMPKVFLGGSIEMGKAEDWQAALVKRFENDDIVFLNPRRDDWDSSWVQDPTPGTQFHEQVQWELRAQEFHSDLIVYNFCPGTMSPITLLELGAFKNKNVLVHCPKDYARYGNVVMTCEFFGIKMVDDISHLEAEIRRKLIAVTEYSAQELRKLPMHGEYQGITLGEYFDDLLMTLWEQGEGFSGKRPFGNSGWENDVYIALLAAQATAGYISFDEDGWVEDFDIHNKSHADSLVYKMIRGE